MKLFEGETIWIVGASSGIGAALAKKLNDEGALLILSARRTGDLETLNRSLGGAHFVLALDVSDPSSLAAAFETLASKGRSVDRAIFLAALYEPSHIRDMDMDHLKNQLMVNVYGCLAFAKAALLMMKPQRRGQIAICGSVAAYMGLPKGQPYSASKAAVRNFTESLAVEAPPHIDIKLISPGFVKTRITDKNDFEMPFIMEVDQAAERIARGLTSSGFEIHFPKRFTLLLKFLALLPYGLSLRLTRRL